MSRNITNFFTYTSTHTHPKSLVWTLFWVDQVTITISHFLICLFVLQIRSPSSMAISWSYVHSKFWLLWKKKVSYPLFYKRCNFLSFASISFTSFKKMQLYRPVILLSVIWCFPIWLTSFIKLSNGDLHCELIWTSFCNNVCFNSVVIISLELKIISKKPRNICHLCYMSVCTILSVVASIVNTVLALRLFTEWISNWK